MGSNPTATATPLLTSSHFRGGFNVPRWAPWEFQLAGNHVCGPACEDLAKAGTRQTRRRGVQHATWCKIVGDGWRSCAGGWADGFRRHELELGHPNGLGRPRRFDVTQVEAELA